MATTRRHGGTDGASELAATLGDSSFLHVIAHADGDALAAGGLLARGAAARDRPFQLSVEPAGADARRRVAATDEATTAVAVGHAAPEAAAAVTDRPATAAVAAALADAGAPIDPGVGLAGLLAAGESPAVDADESGDGGVGGDGGDGGDDRTDDVPGTGDGSAAGVAAVRDAARTASVDRAPGVGVPTPAGEPADGLAHTTLFRAPFSGDPDAAAESVASVDAGAVIGVGATDDPGTDGGSSAASGDARRLASLVAIDATDCEAGSDAGDADRRRRAATAVERALRPHVLPDGPVATAEGFADVLSALAAVAPGRGAALAAGRIGAGAVLEDWREHARRAHGAVADAPLARYSGLVRVETVGPLRTVARLVRDFRASEPAVLAAGGGRLALATTDADAPRLLGAAVEGDAAGTARLASAPFDGDVDEAATRLRGSL